MGDNRIIWLVEYFLEASMKIFDVLEVSTKNVDVLEVSMKFLDVLEVSMKFIDVLIAVSKEIFEVLLEVSIKSLWCSMEFFDGLFWLVKNFLKLSIKIFNVQGF